MNKLNTIIIILLSFVLLSPVFTTISYANADIFTDSTTLYYSGTFGVTRVSGSLSNFNLGYGDSQFNTLFRNFSSSLTSNLSYTNEEVSSVLDNLLINASSYYGKTFDSYLFCGYGTNNFNLFLFNSKEVDIIRQENSSVYYSLLQGSSFLQLADNTNTKTGVFYYENVIGGEISYVGGKVRVNSDLSVKLATSVSLDNSGRNYTILWDGTSYYQKIEEPSEPDIPIFPTNTEIASAVQKFYNSDIYKNNTNFKDFIVVYSSLKNTYAFIGTDITLNQHIYYDGASDYGGFSSSETWWAFHNPRILDGYLYNNKFYLYFIEGDSDVITNEGVGTIADLENSRYSMNMTIVYSTYDYTVYEHRPPLEGETDNQVTSGTIQGDSYTYDENLDPTDSEYSPLQNYVPSDPTQSILNDVDFDSINQAFEDGKVILNIENASWIFTANNQLVEYFLGFISFLIVLIAISRVLGG